MKKAYNKLYLSDICELQADMFDMLEDNYLEKADYEWFITEFMKSEYRDRLDKGNFIMANMTPDFLIDLFIKREKNGYYLKSSRNSIGNYSLYWAGFIYSLYQWTYNVKSKDLIETIPLKTMLVYFITLHQTAEEIAVKKIHEFIKRDGL